MSWEVDAISAKTNSTSIGYEEKRSETEHWTGIPKAAGTAVRIFRETHVISAMASSTTQDTIHRAQKWLINLCSICLYLPQ